MAIGNELLVVPDYHEEDEGGNTIGDPLLLECAAYRACQSEQRLFHLPFESLQQYLVLLKYVAMESTVFQERFCFYLAAAVSDFYIPSEQVTIPLTRFAVHSI